MKKILSFPLVQLIFFLAIFILLDIGVSFESKTQLIRPISFALIATALFSNYLSRKIALIGAVIALVVMITLYLLNQIESADLVGSFGFGVLIIVVVSYLPQLIREGKVAY